MPIQNLNESVRLYELLGKYVPEVPDDTVLDYVNSIFENIKKDENYDVYFYALEIMTGKGYDELSQSDPVSVLELFIQALTEWHILELVAFFRNIGYKNDQST
jgi:hypothetical protein